MKWIPLILIILFSCSSKIYREVQYYDDSKNKIIRYYNKNNTLIKEEVFNLKNQIIIINEYDYNIKKIKIFYENGRIQTEKTYRLIRLKIRHNEELDRFLRTFRNKSLPLPSLTKDMNIKEKDFSDVIDIKNIKEVKIAQMSNWNDYDSDYGFLINDKIWTHYNDDGSIKEILFYNRGILEQKIIYKNNIIINVINYDINGNIID